jgi:Zinc knuckle
MSEGSSSRSRRKGVNYSPVLKTNVLENTKFSPIVTTGKSKKKSTDETIEDILTTSLGSNTQPQVIIQTKSKSNIDTTLQLNENTPEVANETLMEENIGNKETNNQPWISVSKGKKGKQKENFLNTNKNDNEKEDNESIVSYESENDYQTDWRNTMNARKYKIWTLASKIPGKNISEKIEKIKKIFCGEKSLITVTSEFSANNRMISALFSNAEAMQEARKCDVGSNEIQPTHMHRAQIFKRNLEKEKLFGVKLWDIPVGIKYKEIKTELELKFGQIERLSLRVNNMWQSAIVIFKTQESASKVLENWSILIGDDSLRVTQLDQTIKDLLSRGEHAAKVIGLPPGITARELLPHIEALGAKTCYIPRTRTYRRRAEAVVSFVSGEQRNAALEVAWKVNNFNIKIIDLSIRTCRRCQAEGHFVKDCPRTLRDEEFKEKNVDRLNKFGNIYKKHNPRYFNIVNKQVGGLSYADVTKKRMTIPTEEENREDSRLLRIEALLTNVAERLEALEQHVWQKTEADVDDLSSDEEMDSENEMMQEDNSETPEKEKESVKKTNTTDKLLTAMTQILTRMELLEKKVYMPSTTIGSGTTSNVNAGSSQ